MSIWILPPPDFSALSTEPAPNADRGSERDGRVRCALSLCRYASVGSRTIRGDHVVPGMRFEYHIWFIVEIEVFTRSRKYFRQASCMNIATNQSKEAVVESVAVPVAVATAAYVFNGIERTLLWYIYTTCWITCTYVVSASTTRV